jgi:hypothetical protein
LDSGDRGPPVEPGGRRLKVCRCSYGGRALLLPEEAERCGRGEVAAARERLIGATGQPAQPQPVGGGTAQGAVARGPPPQVAS